MNSLAKLTAVTAIALTAALVSASPATANTVPNSYTATNAAWVDVPSAQRVYFESFGSDWDDSSMFEVPVGVQCTYSGVTADGPFLTSAPLTGSECVDAGLAPYAPLNYGTRLGAVPLGFDINFFGTSYVNAWPSTNGGLFFDAPGTGYDDSALALSYAYGPGIFPLPTDLYFAQSESSFWTAQTTVDGQPAVVFSWEKFHNCCTVGASAENLSFQLVLIDLGGGDFNAEFNYDSFANFTEGYSAPSFWFDLARGVTPGSNIVVVDDASTVPPGCTQGAVGWGSAFGTATDTVFEGELTSAAFYYQVVNGAAGTVSLWSDGSCTVPINSNVLQDQAADGVATIEIEPNSATVTAVGAGWGTRDTTTNLITYTALLRNIDSATLENGQPGALISRSLNSAIAGQFIIGQRGGVTVLDPAVLFAGLAATGVDAGAGVVLGALLLLGGAGAIVIARRKRAVRA